MREVPTMSLTMPFLDGLKMVACTAKTQNHRMAPSRLWVRRLQYMPASTQIWSSAMDWMMRALQKRSESQPTNGGKQDEGQHDDGPKRVFQVSLRAVQPDAQGNEQELRPLFIKGILRLDQHESPEGSPWNLAGVSGRMGAGVHEITGWAPPLFPVRSRGTGTARR